MLAVVIWILVGLVLGIAVRLLLRVKDPSGLLVWALIGVSGAVFGGVLGIATGVHDLGERLGHVTATGGSGLALTLNWLTVRHDGSR